MRKVVAYWFFFVVVLVLQSCQSHIETRQQMTIKAQRQHDAAFYNMQLGLAYLHQSDRIRAKQKLLTALDLAPNSAEVNAAMAYFLERTGEINKAREFYHKAMALAPNAGAQLNNYGTFLCRDGHYKEAEKYFLKAARDVRYIHTAAAYENAGLCTMAIPDYDKACFYFKKALAQDPERKQSLIEVAQIELKLHQPNKALEILRQYRQQVLNDAVLLTLAIDAAHQARKYSVEKTFITRLETVNK